MKITKTVDTCGIIRYHNEKGQLHRENGPSIIYPWGTKSWYQNGKRHNENGPASAYADGTKFWFLNDELLSEQQWKDELFKRCFKP